MRFWYPFFMAIMLFGACTPLFAQQVTTLVIPEKIAYSNDCAVNPKIRNHCQLEELIIEFLKKYNRSPYTRLITEKPSSEDYHVLKAEIVEVEGAGGSNWTGAKRIKIKGALFDSEDKVLGTFEAGRFSGGGAFGGFKGRCAILKRCTKTLGKDIGKWLTNPKMDAHLGDH